MDRIAIEKAIDQAEAALDAGLGLRGTGFWKAVDAVKQDPVLVDDFADRMAAIDRRSFESWAFFTLPAAVGTALMTLGTVVGLVLVLWAYSATNPWDGVLLLVGTGITLVTTHGLAHLIVGAASGMTFTHWFIGTIARPQPGVKVDYRTYLRTPAKARARMHASGAVVTKAIPFLALGPAFVIPTPWWTTTLLILIGIAQIATDVLWSTKASDWKKYQREIALADTDSPTS